MRLSSKEVLEVVRSNEDDRLEIELLSLYDTSNIRSQLMERSSKCL
jgi:hypothetical protein